MKIIKIIFSSLLLAVCIVLTATHTAPVGAPGNWALGGVPINVLPGAPIGLTIPAHSTVSYSAPTAQPVRHSEYNAVLDIDPDNLTVNGIERIKYVNLGDTPLSSIYINTYLNAFAGDSAYKPYFDCFKPKIFESGESFGQIRVTSVSVDGSDVEFTHENTILHFNLYTPLAPSNSIVIALSFEADIPKINHRTGANDYALWFGNFLPTMAVHGDDGWQIDNYYAVGYPFYSRIANFNVVINTPAGYTVAGTGQKSVAGGFGKDIVSTTLSAKLVRDFAFAVGSDYKEEQLVTESGVEVTLFYYSGLENAGELLSTACDSLEYFNRIIGSYPYSHLDIVECGLFTDTGMKYPQVIFMDSALLNGSAAAETLVNMLGYQWFYNVIGSNGIADAWIGEGLTMLIADGFFLTDDELDAKIRDEYAALAHRLNYVGNQSMRQHMSAFESWTDYEDIVRMKSKMMAYSLILKMGERFPEFLNKYYTTYSFRTVDAERFIELAEEYCEADLGGFFNAWLGNYPMPEL